ncbi:GNAT family N-acetyltransferase [Candidatus Kaiserbacteria bacterium]|nr:MAG: GNAT family N-acetyltransferase [Candidatus Kaiserbacteria bacterium]
MNEEIFNKNITEPPLSIEAVPDNETSLANILRLEKLCFPAEWQYVDGEEYFADALSDPQSINLFLQNENDVIGYILARPHHLAFEELIDDDPLLTRSIGDRYYIETIQIVPDEQGKGGGNTLIVAVCDEAKKRGVTQFSIHARTNNRLHETIKSLFKEKITLVRPISSWVHASGEPYEYIEWNI